MYYKHIFIEIYKKNYYLYFNVVKFVLKLNYANFQIEQYISHLKPSDVTEFGVTDVALIVFIPKKNN